MNDRCVDICVDLAIVPCFMIAFPKIAMIRMDFKCFRFLGGYFLTWNNASLCIRIKRSLVVRTRLPIRRVPAFKLLRLFNYGMEVVVPYVVMADLPVPFLPKGMFIFLRFFAIRVISRPCGSNMRIIFESMSMTQVAQNGCFIMNRVNVRLRIFDRVGNEIRISASAVRFDEERLSLLMDVLSNSRMTYFFSFVDC